jgi:hypothetical protein
LKKTINNQTEGVEKAARHSSAVHDETIVFLALDMNKNSEGDAAHPLCTAAWPSLPVCLFPFAAILKSPTRVQGTAHPQAFFFAGRAARRGNLPHHRQSCAAFHAITAN